MARLSRQEWLEVGFDLLARHGADGLTVEALCRKLRVTKGSFYHHFSHIRAYGDALLQHWRSQTGAVIAAAERAQAGRGAEAILDHIVGYMAGLAGSGNAEPSIRNWASREARVNAVVRGVDAERIAYGARLLREPAGGPRRALLLSRVLYAMMVGAPQITGVGAAEWRQMYAEFKRWANRSPRREKEPARRARKRSRRRA